jgi:hypothetical protein
MAIDNTVYLGNKNLKKAGVNIGWNGEQLQEYLKCSEDPIYFIKTYIKIVNIDKGLIPFELWPFQEKMVLTSINNRFVIAKMPRQVGKCFSLNTTVKIRNKKTLIEETITVGELYARSIESRMRALSIIDEGTSLTFTEEA